MKRLVLFVLLMTVAFPSFAQESAKKEGFIPPFPVAEEFIPPFPFWDELPKHVQAILAGDDARSPVAAENEDGLLIPDHFRDAYIDLLKSLYENADEKTFQEVIQGTNKIKAQPGCLMC